MADNRQTKKTKDIQSSANPSPGDQTATAECRSGMVGCSMGKKGLKGMLLMAACCGAPLLLLLALPLLGSALGSFGVSALNTLALLACPAGMALMMWMMMRGQRAEVSQQAQTGPVSPPLAASAARSEPRDATVLQNIPPDAGEPVVTASILAQESTVTPLQGPNGQQSADRTRHGNGQQPAVPTRENSNTPTAPSTHE